MSNFSQIEQSFNKSQKVLSSEEEKEEFALFLKKYYDKLEDDKIKESRKLKIHEKQILNIFERTHSIYYNKTSQLYFNYVNDNFVSMNEYC